MNADQADAIMAQLAAYERRIAALEQAAEVAADRLNGEIEGGPSIETMRVRMDSQARTIEGLHMGASY